MMQCGNCDHWVHAKCENLTGEWTVLLGNLSSIIYYLLFCDYRSIFMLTLYIGFAFERKKNICTILILDEMYELLSRLPKNVAYTCVNCTEHHPPKWRTALEKDIQSSISQVLTALLNSRTSTHLLHYRQVTVHI